MPREAVLFNNCIISNLKGSAKNNNDIPISKKFKFNEKSINIKKQKEIEQASSHLAQSFYAYSFLKKNFENVKLLNDYQNHKKFRNIKYNNTKKKI